VGVLGVLGVNTARTYLSGASADLAPKNVLGKGNVDGKSATITWTTDKETMGVVDMERLQLLCYCERLKVVSQPVIQWF